jgi:hypothetical protein
MLGVEVSTHDSEWPPGYDDGGSAHPGCAILIFLFVVSIFVCIVL